MMTRLSCIVVIINIGLICVLAEERYSDKYDYINAHDILANNKLRNEYFNCFMDTAPCPTEDAKFFNGIIAEASQTKCQKCTDKQKEMLNVMIDWYTKNEPDNWNKLSAKFAEDMKKKNARR